MKRNTKLGVGAAAAVLVIAAAAVVGYLVLRGPQTGQANDLVGQTSDILAAISPQVNQTDQLLGQAFNQLSTNQTAAEQTSLNQARGLIIQVTPQLKTAKANIDQAATLDISPAFHDYLQAESSSLGYALDLANTRLQITDLLLADAALSKPESQQQLAQLKKNASDQSNQAQQAEDEANSIADANPKEIR